jgi:hypothetical protein
VHRGCSRQAEISAWPSLRGTYGPSGQAADLRPRCEPGAGRALRSASPGRSLARGHAAAMPPRHAPAIPYARDVPRRLQVPAARRVSRPRRAGLAQPAPASAGHASQPWITVVQVNYLTYVRHTSHARGTSLAPDFECASGASVRGALGADEPAIDRVRNTSWLAGRAGRGLARAARAHSLLRRAPTGLRRTARHTRAGPGRSCAAGGPRPRARRLTHGGRAPTATRAVRSACSAVRERVTRPAGAAARRSAAGPVRPGGRRVVVLGSQPVVVECRTRDPLHVAATLPARARRLTRPPRSESPAIATWLGNPIWPLAEGQDRKEAAGSSPAEGLFRKLPVRLRKSARW